MPQCGIYQIVNTITGDCYVGSAVDLQIRKAKHLRDLRKGTHHSRYLQHAYNKYGENTFTFIFLEEVERDRKLLFQREGDWIRQIQPQYNSGKLAETMLGVKRTEETRKLMSEKASLRRHSEETKQIQAERKRGIKQSPEHIQKRAERMRGHGVSEKNRQALAERSRKMWANRTPEEKRAVVEKRSEEVQEKNRQRMRELGKDPARIEASRQGTIRAKQQRDEAKQQAKMLQVPMSEEEKLEKKRHRYAFTQTPEYKRKRREAREEADALGKPHGGPKPDPSKPRSRHRTKTESTKQQSLFD